MHVLQVSLQIIGDVVLHTSWYTVFINVISKLQKVIVQSNHKEYYRLMIDFEEKDMIDIVDYCKKCSEHRVTLS